MRLLLLLVLSVCAAACVFAFLGGFLFRQSPAESMRDLLEAQRRNADFERRVEVYRQLNEDRNQVVCALVAGRLTFREAAHQFQNLHGQAGIPERPDPVLCSVGEEAWCVRVLTYVRGCSRVAGDEDNCAKIWRLLNQSYRRTFGHSPRLAG